MAPRIPGKRIDRSGSIRLDPQLLSRVRRKAVREDRTMTEMVEEWIRQGLEKES